MSRSTDDRRRFLSTLAATAASGLLPATVQANRETRFPTRAITSGPRHHWFGYYDKLQFDPTSRYVLGMEVGFEHRSPTGRDTIRIGMVDLARKDRWIELGRSNAWCWQQGCMLQWLPGSRHRVLWNDRQRDRFVCHVMDVRSRKRRTVAHPIYSVSPNGRTAVAPDFRRINDVRPGYGYAGLKDPHADQLAPANSGIVRIDRIRFAAPSPASRTGARGAASSSGGFGADRLFRCSVTRSFCSAVMLAKGDDFTNTPTSPQISTNSLWSRPSSLANLKIRIFNECLPHLRPVQPLQPRPLQPQSLQTPVSYKHLTLQTSHLV